MISAVDVPRVLETCTIFSCQARDAARHSFGNGVVSRPEALPPLARLPSLHLNSSSVFKSSSETFSIYSIVLLRSNNMPFESTRNSPVSSRNMLYPHLIFSMVATHAPTQSNCFVEHSRTHEAIIYIVRFDPQGSLININSQRDGLARKPT